MPSARCNIRRVRSDANTAALELSIPGQHRMAAPLVAGDFTAWVPVPMERGADGAFRMRVVIPRGTEFRFRVLQEGDDESFEPHRLARVTV